MESIKINHNTEELKENIELNSFLKNNLGNIDNNKITSDSLLSEEEIKITKQKHEKRDHFYENFSIETLLKFCLKDKKFEIHDNFIEIHSGVNLELPDGYGFKGGAARVVLRDVLGLKNNEPRDFDLIRVNVPEPEEGLDLKLAAQYMEKDFELGDGVEYIDNVDDYFETRDFTINEVYVVNNKIFATEECIRDTLRNIVRVTEYELNKYYHYEEGIGPKMKAKALRFHVEQLYTTGISDLYYEDKYEIEESFINPFWLAVQLDRAFERSTQLADKFTKILVNYKIVPSEITSSYDLLEYLKNELDDDFYFRSVPGEIYDLEDKTEYDQKLDEIEYWENYYDELY